MPNYNFIDLTGQRFGRLTVIKRVEVPVKKGQRKRIKWLCKCDCGNEKIIGTDNLRWGGTKSCGCLSRQISSIIGKRKKKSIIDMICWVIMVLGIPVKTNCFTSI